MQPTLQSGQIVVFDAFTYRYLRDPRRFDIVLFNCPCRRNHLAIKRIIAVSGDTIEIHDGRVSIVGSPLSEPYAIGRITSTLDRQTVPSGHYFVLGDNRSTFGDSRAWGWLPETRILARACGVGGRSSHGEEAPRHLGRFRNLRRLLDVRAGQVFVPRIRGLGRPKANSGPLTRALA
jgi:signal peptidase I